MDNFIKLVKQCLDRNDHLMFINEILKIIFQTIKEANSLNEADTAFNLLGDIQNLLAAAVFKEQVIVNKFLKKFIYDFDRIDDYEMRHHLYSKIKSNEYLII